MANFQTNGRFLVKIDRIVLNDKGFVNYSPVTNIHVSRLIFHRRR